MRVVVVMPSAHFTPAYERRITSQAEGNGALRIVEVVGA
jgi:hypothetical protein